MKLVLPTALLAAMALLSACGGGGGTEAPAAPSGTSLGGVVAVGEPLVGATVTSWCGDGTLGPRTTTDAGGKYVLIMPEGCPTPWMVRARGETPRPATLLSFINHTPTGSPDAVSLNITPITTLMAELITQRTSPEGFPDSIEVLAMMARLIDADTKAFLAQLQAGMNLWMQEPHPELFTMEGIMSRPFLPMPGDPMDDLISGMSQVRGQVGWEALAEQLSPSGGSLASGQPWKTLFGDATSLSFTGVSCTGALGNPAGDATLTLRMRGQDLQVEMVSDLFGAPATFAVGPAVSSDFQLTVEGDSPLVDVMASSNGRKFELFSDAGAAKVSLSDLGNIAVCTLSNPVRRADLVAFQPAARILGVMPADGVRGTCPALDPLPAYSYEISRMGDVRFNGTSLPADWLDASYAHYRESLQFHMGAEPSFQLELSALPTVQGIRLYYFHSIPYGQSCMNQLQPAG